MKKWISIAVCALIMILAGYRIYELNSSAQRVRVVNESGKFGRQSPGLIGMTLKKPTIEKKSMRGVNVLNVKVSYNISVKNVFSKNHTFLQKMAVSRLIRVKAAGTVWQAQPGKLEVLTEKRRHASGVAIVPLYIQKGYSEKDLRNLTVYVLQTTDTNTKVLTKYSE